VGFPHTLKRALSRAVALIGELKPRRLKAAGTITGSVDGWLCYCLHKILGEAPARICL
jgi:hypothetical protein